MLSHIKSILAFPIFLWVSDSFLTILDLDSFWAFAKILCNAQSFLTITIFLWVSIIFDDFAFSIHSGRLREFGAMLCHF